MIKACIMLKKLDISQMGFYLCRSVNQILADTYNIDISIYYQNWGKPPIPPRFTMLMEREVFGLQGTVISTDIRTTQHLIRCPGPTKKFFYVWNLEWLAAQTINYMSLYDIYCNDKIELIARSKSHFDLLSKIWKEPKYIMEDFDKNTLLEIIQ